MIAIMREGANVSEIENVILFFQRREFDVCVKKADAKKNGNGQALIAALGCGQKPDYFTVRFLAGVRDVKESNDLFFSEHEKFVEAWQYFAAIDA